MTYQLRAILVLILVSSSTFAGSFPAGATQTPSPTISVDVPSEGTVLRPGSRIWIGGWASDPESPSGPGVAASQGVHVYFGEPAGMDAPGAVVRYGSARPDVAAAFGRADWASSGFGGEAIMPRLPTGPSTLYIYAYFERVGWYSVTVPIQVGTPISGGAVPLSPGASVTTVTPSGIPGPTDLRLVRASPIDAVLSWRPAAGTEIASYRVYVDIGAGDCLVGTQGCGTLSATTNSQATITSLPYAPTRTFIVTGVTPDGRETDPSNRIRMVLGADPFG